MSDAWRKYQAAVTKADEDLAEAIAEAVAQARNVCRYTKKQAQREYEESMR